MACIRFCLVKTASVTRLDTKIVIMEYSAYSQPKVRPAISIIIPLTIKEILPTFRPVFFRTVRLTISVPPLEMLDLRAKPIPVPITTPPKRALIIGLSVKVTSGTNWIKSELMVTVIKVKMVNLCPIWYQARIISGILIA